MIRRISVALLLPLLAVASVRVYDVAPFRNLHGTVPMGDMLVQSWVAVSDSLLAVDLFEGALPENPSSPYDIQIRDGGTLLYTSTAPCSSYRYVKAGLTPASPYFPLVKGKSYLLIVSHSGSGFDFYYDTTQSRYPYGSLTIQGGGGNYGVDWELSCRIWGINRPISPEYFGVAGWMGCYFEDYGWLSGITNRILDSARSAGVRWWRDGISFNRVETTHFDVRSPCEPCNTVIGWHGADTMMSWTARHGIHVLPMLSGSPWWARTYLDSVVRHDSVFYDYDNPPRDLDSTPLNGDGTPNIHNPWSFFIYQVFARYKPGGFFWEHVLGNPALGDTYGIRTVELPNEPNDLTNWWKYANDTFYRNISRGDTITRQERLYALLCDVACRAAQAAYSPAQVLIGCTGGVHMYGPNDVTEGWKHVRLVPGVDWLQNCYGYMEYKNLAGGTTVHPYEYKSSRHGLDNSWAINPDTFARDVDDVRRIMGTNGQEGKPLCVTELGWWPDWSVEEEIGRKLGQSQFPWLHLDCPSERSMIARAKNGADRGSR